MPASLPIGGVNAVKNILSAQPPILNGNYPFLPNQQLELMSDAVTTVYGANMPGRGPAAGTGLLSPTPAAGTLFIATLAAALGNAEIDIPIGAIGHVALDTSNDSVVDTGVAAPSTPANVLRAVVIREATGEVLRRRGNDILDQAAVVAVTSAATNILTLTAHGLTTGSVVVPAATYGAGPGLVAGTAYFVNRIDANTFNVAATLADLAAGTYITVGTVAAPANFIFGYMSTSSFKVKTGTASAGVIRVRGPASGSWKAGETLRIVVLPAASIFGVVLDSTGDTPVAASAIALNANRLTHGRVFDLMYAAVAANGEVNLRAALAS
jgi:hypothetical protein